LIFHLIEVADCRARQVEHPVISIIPERIARQVATFMREIVLPHALRADAVMFNTEQAGHAQWIAGLILSRKMERIAHRDIVRVYKPFKAPEARREMDAVLASLVAVGWLEPEEPSNLAKGVSSWKVNPGVHIVFASRAQEEADRRAGAREKIAAAAAQVRALRQQQAG
jgi:hypothetical protein